MKSFWCVVLALACQACRSGPEEVVDLAPPAPSDSVAPAEEAGAPLAAPTEPPSCEPALVLSPSAFATRWPALLSRRVRLHVRPLRALSFAEWLVSAGGQRFVVLAAPDTQWAGEHVFFITGSTIAPVHGRTELPELLLDDDCSS